MSYTINNYKETVQPKNKLRIYIYKRQKYCINNINNIPNKVYVI